MALEPVRNVSLGVHQEISWQSHDAFIRATTGCWWQLGNSGSRNVYADDGEVAALKFPNIRATTATCGLRSILVRVRTYAFDKSHVRLLL
jgi:hypothetical protein